MVEFKFISYSAENGFPPGRDIVKQLPFSVAAHRQKLLERSGIPIADIKLVGLLLKDWGNHKAQSIILATDEVFAKDTRFAISTFTILDSWPTKW